MSLNIKLIISAISLFLINSTSHAFQWGFAERQGHRPTMEDAHVIEQQSGPYAAYAIFDGHGGRKAADYAKMKFAADLVVETPLYSQDTMRAWIKKVESNLADEDINADGTTMVAAFINKTTKEARLFWVGDSRAVVVRNGKVIEATVDHKPTNQPHGKRAHS